MWNIPNLLLANLLSEIEQKHDGNNAKMMNEVFELLDEATEEEEKEDEKRPEEEPK